ncbi:MAG: ATP-dependent DNA helicase RecG [Candidatus Wildermuthbacteria bacterium RIFCSPHIGHO2_02_FULL_45_25]|uniref:ATP-dependent DNA helicase RecG n=1 Tax=Candidatus Wildermuthbacteria bacterium RIFCSPHIGHO2_02_FULL_45_25 TaxID=1802450 RepID=A0A1G2R2B8_9BACT|nr:MAG: ATP-dependent DNA helicase RecG [Candidatus Wildermuthbacteria bacterium RIFCSPHIGHO2_02_FULL_45_25]
MNLSAPISSIPRVGPAYEKKLHKLGIHTIRDMLFHFPRTYEDWSVITPIENVTEGKSWCVCGEILEIKQIRTYKKGMSFVNAVLQDTTGAIKVRWFNQPYLADTLKNQDKVCLAGKVMRDKEGIYLASPAFEKLKEGESPFEHLTHTGRIIPIYPETTGVSSRWIRSIIKMILAKHGKDIQEILPPRILQERGLSPLAPSLWSIHFPTSLQEAKHAEKRFAFEELFYILLFILSERKKIARVKAPVIPLDTDLMQRFTKKLKFQLTDDQKKSAWSILKDMEKPRPMNRLLQGDVGSGKTVVSAMAALSAVKQGYQVALLAPTEILAQQHFKTIAELLTPFKITIGLLTGKSDRFISPKLPHDYIEISQKKLLERIQANEIEMLVGTHSLITDKVKFDNLALVIVDEQHRFGIKQRAALLKRSTLIPHLLSMTATPIPRTLAMTIYGDLDLSLIAQMPKGRKQIITKVIAPEDRPKAYKTIEQEIEKGRQAFVICPRIERTEKTPPQLEIKTVKEEHERLSREVFPDLRLAMLHGKMPAKEKELAMRKFKAGKFDILVSTSVVEVGVDIPNATIMFIEGADRFGLAQLHQFRGRVGRGKHQSYCFLFSESANRTGIKRLRALEKSASGFELAETDLKLRGPGDFAGAKQWGMPDFAMQQLTNLQLVQEAREAAKQILEEDITLRTYPALQAKTQELRAKLHLE